jgi:hypothetical protein
MRVAGRGQRQWSYAGRVQFVLLHIPHFLPAVVGLGFLARFGVYAMRLPPAHLSDEELAEWHRQKQAAEVPPRAVATATARLSTAALPLLIAGLVTGLLIYTIDLRDDRPSAAMSWTHTLTSTAGLVLIAFKLRALEAGRLHEGLRRRNALTEGISLLLLASSVPLLLSGLPLIWNPSHGSIVARTHLVFAAIWMVVFQIHVFRYLGRALRATQVGAGEGAPPPARQAG